MCFILHLLIFSIDVDKGSASKTIPALALQVNDEACKNIYVNFYFIHFILNKSAGSKSERSRC